MKKQHNRKRFPRIALALLLILSMLGNTLILPAVAQETVTPAEENLLPETPLDGTSDATGVPTLPEPILLTAADIPEFISSAELDERGAVERMRAEETTMSNIIFRNADGTRTMYMYGLPVKYTTADGTVRDKSTNLVSVSTAAVLLANQPVAETMAQMSTTQRAALQEELGILDVERAADTLHMLSTALTSRGKSLSDMAYTTLDNDVYALFPTNLAKGMTLVFSEHSVRMTPAGTGMTVTAGGNVTKTTASSLSDANVTERLLYPNVFGPGTAVQYTPTLTGVKEEILLARNVGKNSFAFLLETGGLVLAQQNGQYVLVDPSINETVSSLGSIIVYDSAGKIALGTLTAQTILAGQKYGITISVDQEFLAGATYPVSIDPTISIYSSNAINYTIEDTGIYENGNEDYMISGKHQVGLCGDSNLSFRGSVLYRFPFIYDESNFSNFPGGLIAEDIFSFELNIPIVQNNTSEVRLQTNGYLTHWTDYEDIFSGFYYLSYSLTYTSEVNASISTGNVSIDITEITRAWFNYINDTDSGSKANPEYGIILQPNATGAHYLIPTIEAGANVYVVVDYRTIGGQGSYYLNSKYTRTFLGRTEDDEVVMMSGNVSEIGDQIAWDIEYLGNEEYAIHPQGEGARYLNYDAVIENYTGTTLPQKLRWTMSTSGGVSFTNDLFGEMLCVDSTGNVYTPMTLTDPAQKAWRMIGADVYDELTSFSLESSTIWIAPQESQSILNYISVGDYDFALPEDFSIYIPSSSSGATATGHILSGITPNSSGLMRIIHIPTGYSRYALINVAPLAEGEYFLRNGDIGKYIQIAEGEAPDYDEYGAAMELWDFDSGNHQKWIFTREYLNYYSIVSAQSGLALTVQSEDVNVGGYALAQETNYCFNRQLWKFTLTSNGTYVIRPKSAEEYTTDWCISKGSTTSNGTNVIQSVYNGADAVYLDEWYILQPDFYIYVLYDNAFASRYSNRIDNIAEDMLNVHEVYWTNFNFFIAYSEATLFKSLADECADECSDVCTCECTGECTDECINACFVGCHNTSPTNLCAHGNDCETSHHKNASRILNALPLFNPPNEINMPTATLAYIGHDICVPDEGSASGCKKDLSLFGLAHTRGRKAIIMNTYEGVLEQIVPLIDVDIYIRATVLHEIGHWFNAPDHYDDDASDPYMYSTDEINEVNKTEKFSRRCAYGEGKIWAEIIADNLICQGCKDEIEKYINEIYR